MTSKFITERLIFPSYFFGAAITPTSITSPLTEIALLSEKVKFNLKVTELFLLRTMYFCKFHFMSTTKQICFNNSRLHNMLFPFIFDNILIHLYISCYLVVTDACLRLTSVI